MTVDLKLSMHPDRIYKRTELEWKMIEEELTQLPPQKEGDISLDVIYTVQWEDKLEVGYYLRNATNKSLYFTKPIVKLINTAGQVLAKQIINLSEVKDIEPYSVRPYELFFTNENVLVDKIENINLRIELENNEPFLPYAYIIEDLEPEPLTAEQTSNLIQKLKTMPPIKDGEIKVYRDQAKLKEDGTIEASIIIKHKLTNPVAISRIQMAMLDEQSQLIAQAVFKIEETVIESGMFFFRTLTFPLETIAVKEINLNNWKVVLI